MKKKFLRKLSLHSEVIRLLTPRQSSSVAGAFIPGESGDFLCTMTCMAAAAAAPVVPATSSAL
jgi:hypothetical protein